MKPRVSVSAHAQGSSQSDREGNGSAWSLDRSLAVAGAAAIVLLSAQGADAKVVLAKKEPKKVRPKRTRRQNTRSID